MTRMHLETYTFNRADSIDTNGLPCFAALLDKTGKPVSCLLPPLPLCKTGGGLKCASVYYATYQIPGFTLGGPRPVACNPNTTPGCDAPKIIGSSMILGYSKSGSPYNVAPWCLSSSGNCPVAPAISKVEITWQYPGSPIITGLKFSLWVPGDGKAGMGRGP